MKTIAVIPAAGEGKRFKSHIAKQFFLLEGLPILVRTLKVFQASRRIDAIVLALPRDAIVPARQTLMEQYGLTKIASIVPGGGERQDSVKNCLANVDRNCEWVMVHDAVRPFVTEELIDRVLEAARKTGAATCGVPVKDTLKETRHSETVFRTLSRDNMWLTQTPQAFRLDILKSAYQKAEEEKVFTTDDASLVERLGVEVAMVHGLVENLKITTREDLMMAEALMRRKRMDSFRTGLGYDSHRLVDGRKLLLGGVEIPFAKGLEGHSDADALVHAVCDALLGAAGCGDIGRHFPDDDPQYKNISSLILLGKVKEVVNGKGYSIRNIDVTVVMEEPKIAPHVGQMIFNLHRVLDIPESCINIKVKTNERMGWVGRKEGVAVFATSLLEKVHDIKS
jgi:2-C-methyl-D-erythritol 4-phosphate cytidylyltransferase/2-C-methyl-D-erythritol 2,4-cyclodiphosphate synthase